MGNDFIMTLSSDEEGPSPSKASTSASSSRPKPAAKLTRKEQLKARKGAKPTKQKRKRTEGSSDEGEEEMVQPGSDEETMSTDFVFDGLGGGFVGEKRQQVWVSRGAGCARLEQLSSERSWAAQAGEQELTYFLLLAGLGTKLHHDHSP